MVRKSCLILLAILLLAVSLSACSRSADTTTTAATTTPAAITTTTTTAAAPTTEPAPTQQPIIITDQYGRTVTLKAYPQRIISMSPAHTEILFALGLGDRIVGVSDYSDYPEEALTKENIGSYDTPNLEKIISLEPDLVLGTEEHEEQIAQMEKYNIPVVALNPKTVSDVLDTITLIGKATGQDKEAAALVTDMQSRMYKITAKTAALTDAQKPRVFVVIWHDPIWTVGAGTFHDELIQMAGGVNITGDLEGYTDISLEVVIDRNPQIIIAGVGMGTGSDASLVAMQTDERLANLDARIDNKVYGANMDIISRPGPRLVEALETIFSLIHPELQ